MTTHGGDRSHYKDLGNQILLIACPCSMYANMQMVKEHCKMAPFQKRRGRPALEWGMYLKMEITDRLLQPGDCENRDLQKLKTGSSQRGETNKQEEEIARQLQLYEASSKLFTVVRMMFVKMTLMSAFISAEQINSSDSGMYCS